MNQTTLCVSAIKEGTVIDHIAPGGALQMMRIFRLDEKGVQITIGLNLQSASRGVKDLIKIERLFLSEKELACVAIFSPHATVNEIRDYKVAQKRALCIPDAIDALLECPNARCITRHEPVSTCFLVEQYDGLVQLHCRHCEQILSTNANSEKTIGKTS